MELDEKPRIVRTTKLRRRSRRRRVVERFMLVLGVPALLFAFVALSAGVIEYIPSTTTNVKHAPIEAHHYEPPEMVDLGFDGSFRRNTAAPNFDWSKRRARFDK